ncbi:LytR/AlgR family response regulator transcription factor [Emticicia aquatilis]|nr:LytTR family DNA-binding domain-containing protein [Emticicia aquatilis]
MINIRTKVSPDKILFCEADINYTRIYYQDRMEIIAVTLKDVEKRLDSQYFYRIHKSYLVNIQYVMPNDFSREILMPNQRSITVSRRRMSLFKKMLKHKHLIMA